ncbi:MAG: NADPH:quinone reductase [Sphingobacterium sp.]|jgi:putative NADPH-quinone reductase|uniref:NAD(P)H-dependent oxidoreductase n=1 Tax=unclassified Sphingobacterium TaxID=2609468 RepID=UPI000987167D|nr:NAD(P)H-dependent oxidoreductase [Sphingobacterium sp. CZ-UAM]MDF2515429.1 NADPH:quinone reductase [Sphingobacterium sp.]OOG16071.1 NADPH:quinone reductase [Sphingobacterium sp. CZ-UAM]
MKKRILIINGHPNRESFNFGIAAAYKDGAEESGAEVRSINIADLNFNPNLQFGYQKRTEVEPDLLQAWEDILWAEHLVWVHPVWWGGLPAIMKGFIDRLFLPGYAFQYRENSPFWDKLLKGKSARIITTLDQPSWYYALVYGRPSVNQLKRSTLQFCGISSVKVTYIEIIKTSNTTKRNKWLFKIKLLGKKQG